MDLGSTAVDTKPDRQWRFQRGDWLATAFILVTALIVRGIWIGDPASDLDEQLYSFIGWRMTHGELPYVDWWDRKPFGLFAIFALAHAIGGPESAAYQLLALIFALVGAAVTYDLARRLVDPFAAAFAASLGLILTAGFGAQSGNSEVFFVPLTLIMLWLLSQPDHRHSSQRRILAMLVGGLALQVKYTVLPICIAFGIVALWQEWQRNRQFANLVRSAFLFALAGLIPTILVGLFYLASGYWEDWFFANFVSFFDRLPAPLGRWTPRYIAASAPFLLMYVGGLYAARRFAPPKDPALYILFVVYGLATIGGVFLPSTVYLYYFAAFAGPAPLLALPLLDRRGPGGPFPAIVLFFLFAFMINVPARTAQSQLQRTSVVSFAEAISPHVDSRSRCMWIHDGPTVLYRLTGSCVPTKFVYPDHLNNALETPAIGIDQTAEVIRILATRPPVIVSADHAVTVQNEQARAIVQDTLARDYVPFTKAKVTGRAITAWVRREP